MEIISTNKAKMRGLLVSLCALSLAVFAVAQPRPVVSNSSLTKMKPGEVRNFTPMPNRTKKRSINTKKFFPQVARTITSKGVRPTNPEIKPNFQMTMEEFRLRTRGGKAPTPGGTIGSTTGTTTTTLTDKFPGIGFTGSLPPDIHMAVGPNFVVQVVNSNIAFFNKTTGQAVFSQPLSDSGFLPGAGSFVFDPRVVFDPDTNKFIVIALDVDDANEESYVHIAISDDADPNGNWTILKVDNQLPDGNGNKRWGDYPTVTTGLDSIVLTFNHFPFTNGAVNGTIWVVRKSDEAVFSTVANTFSISMAKKFTAGAGSPVGASLSFPFLFQGTVPIDPALDFFGVLDQVNPPQLTTTSMDIPVFVRQAEGAETAGFRIDAIGDRMMDMTRTADDVVFAFTCNVGPDGDGYANISVDQPQPLQTKVRWGEVNMNNWPDGANQPTLTQSGDVADPIGTRQSFSMPAIAKNTQGSIMIVATATKNDMTPRVIATSRILSDPVGTMGLPQVFAASADFTLNSPTGTSRWGDYAGIGLDPQDPEVFWGSHEIFTAANLRWGSEIFNLRVNGAITGGGPPMSVTPIFGTNTGGNGTSFATKDDNDIYTMDTEYINNRGQYAGYEAVYDASGVTSGARLVFNMFATTPGVSAYVYVFNHQKNKFDLVNSTRLKTTPEDLVINFVSQQMNAYKAPGTGAMTVRVVTILTTKRRGSVPVPYVFSTDRGTLN